MKGFIHWLRYEMGIEQLLAALLFAVVVGGLITGALLAMNTPPDDHAFNDALAETTCVNLGYTRWGWVEDESGQPVVYCIKVEGESLHLFDIPAEYLPEVNGGE